jgi:curved DNA-binding protein CbpA
MYSKTASRQNDLYKTLGLKRNCSKKDIKKQFHTLALQCHPDKTINSQEGKAKFTSIQEAYQVLMDDKKRKIYDKLGFKGLALEQECQDFVKSNANNVFYQSGFGGSDKSAFDILRDIMEENEEPSSVYDDISSGFSDDFKTTMRSYIENNVESTDSDEEDFCSRYRPIFMNQDFLKSSTLLQHQLEKTPNFNHSQQQTSYSFTDNNGKQYTKTVNSTLMNGKGKVNIHETLKNGDSVLENQQERDVDFSNNENKPLPISRYLDENCDSSEEETTFPSLGLSKASKRIFKEKDY